jgi:hypothetical protein
MNKENVKLLQCLIDKVVLEQECIEQRIKNGTVEESATNDEVVALAKGLIADITRVKRIIHMLEDVKSMCRLT